MHKINWVTTGATPQKKRHFQLFTRDTEYLGKSQNKESNLFFTSLVRQYTKIYLLKILNFIETKGSQTALEIFEPFFIIISL